MFEAFLDGLAGMGNPAVIGAIVLGTMLGVLFGVIPGLGSVIAMTLILPFTFGWDPIIAMYVFAGIIGTASTGGGVPAILLNTPGTIANVCTTFDGFPMTRRGEGGRAIGLAATASALGTLFSIVVLAALLPLAEIMLRSFTPPDFFWLIILGLIAVTFASRQNMVKGLAAGGVGILIALIGFSPVFGVRRYTLGSEYLWDGIEIVPLVIGFFALSELIVYTSRGGSIARDAGRQPRRVPPDHARRSGGVPVQGDPAARLGHRDGHRGDTRRGRRGGELPLLLDGQAGVQDP